MGLFKKQQKSLPLRRHAPAGDIRDESALTDIDQRYNFRRNRTLTGSSSSDVTSASEGKAQLKSPRVHTHELIKKRRRVSILLVVASAGALSIYGLIVQFTAEPLVHAPGVPVSLDTSYSTAIQSYFAAHPIERLRFLTNQSQLERFVKDKLPEVASLRIGSQAGFGKSDFVLTMRRPLAGWTIQNKQQYVDAMGVAFSKNYYPAPSVQIVDNSGIRADHGQVVVASNRFLSFVGQTVGLAKQQGFIVAQVVIPPASTRQVELRLEGKTYPIKLSIDREVGEQIEDMARTIQWFDSRRQTPQYIDVRVSGKAFYR